MSGGGGVWVCVCLWACVGVWVCVGVYVFVCECVLCASVFCVGEFDLLLLLFLHFFLSLFFLSFSLHYGPEQKKT